MEKFNLDNFNEKPTLKDYMFKWNIEYFSNRIKRLIEIKAPEVILEGAKMTLDKIKSGWIGIKNFEKYENLLVENVERKTGRGGKIYFEMKLNEIEVNYFPQAKYGAIIFPKNK